MAGFNGPIALQQDLFFPTDLPTPRFEANTDVDDAENNSVALENGEKRSDEFKLCLDAGVSSIVPNRPC